ncbi:DUF4352 domain-containing protein [Streptomyces sp. NPDC048442]|uniref:DUF4352 domain-containing protein n=1 Tax=Streptomyces sp. NPDC048442 TaxID=3154823 RepID=UPI003445A994
MSTGNAPQWQQPSAPPPKQRSWFVRHKVMTVLLALLAFIVVIGIASSIGGGGDRDVGKTTPSSDVPGNQSKKPEKKDIPGLGDAVRDGKFEFTVTRIQDGVRKIGSSDFGEVAQGQFILVHLKVENVGAESQTFDGSDQKLIGPGGKEYSADTSAGIYLNDSNSYLERINPGNSVAGVIIYDVPKSVIPQSIELHDSFLSGGVVVDLQ